MKIAMAQQNYHVGNFEENTRKIIDAIRQAKQSGADLVVFTELSVCGYPPRDFLEFEDFIAQCYASVDRIREEADTIGVIVGSPARNTDPLGKDLFNAAWFLFEKEVKGIAHKTCLPTYDVFDEYRYFEPGYEWKVIPFKGKKIALTICEDIWNLGDNPLYRVCPMDQLIGQEPDLMINISASPFDYDHDEDRKEVVRQNVLKYKIPMYYCNAVGSQTEIVFDGGSLVYDAKGRLVKELKYFEEDLAVIDLPAPVPPLFEELLPGFSIPIHSEEAGDDDLTAPTGKPSVPGVATTTTDAPAGSAAGESTLFDKEMRVSRLKDPNKVIEYLVDQENIREIHQALILGIRDYFSKMGFAKAILGSSGGIDSAVTLALACEALGKDNVRAILLPSPYSTSHSVSDAEQLSRKLGNPYDIIPIREVYESLLHTLEPVFKGTAFGLAEENLQSRTRGNILMAIANKFGYILLNTSNKSELSTGYGTLYGDMAGGLSVLGDVYKLQVYALARYINRNGEIIPANILEKAPSAELRPDQKDSDSLPEYDVLDKVLYQYIERRKGPKEIIAMGIDEALVRRVLRLVNTNEYKRNQFCPIIRVSSKAFGVGRRMPIVGKYLS
ncbi:NAD+ synthase [Flavitalea sp. BT771]|uniref:NAD+ synthase n=1 Tax=Flavitalea sp. BT771 TaxID=3063329 RepID=UPI0026E2CBE7|nr:NAD+ synthase [Flavitalea sp. BT771]MDO6433860.1 NAD+ synthase [Flavitalea sp. BT771]MDV6222235.1 NAD+ synthase [Flavitalea sp. BT771]